MNDISKTIGWAEKSWNPFVGCKNNCYYCYAKEMNKRFKFIKDWNEPQFFPERLDEPCKLKKPSVIFVGSMCDLWYANDKILFLILSICKTNPQHTFLFLTKNPELYNKHPLFNSLKNVWLGVTATNNKDIGKAYILRHIFGDMINERQRRFISIEPILDKVDISVYDIHTKIIVGAMTGKNPVIPKVEWIENIYNQAKDIFWKSNIRKYLPDYIKQNIKEKINWN
jgi:protein gp37